MWPASAKVVRSSPAVPIDRDTATTPTTATPIAHVTRTIAKSAPGRANSNDAMKTSTNVRASGQARPNSSRRRHEPASWTAATTSMAIATARPAMPIERRGTSASARPTPVHAAA
jgi:hypothetical protein